MTDHEDGRRRLAELIAKWRRIAQQHREEDWSLVGAYAHWACADELEAVLAADAVALPAPVCDCSGTMAGSHSPTCVSRKGALALPAPAEPPDVQLLAWAVTNCHTLARRALTRTPPAFDREKWEHVLRICEKAGARSQGVLRAALPTEITEGAAVPAQPPQGCTCWLGIRGATYGDSAKREQCAVHGENATSPDADQKG